MAEVLVLAEQAGGEVKKVTLELLTAAARLGEPAVVWTGPDADKAQQRLAEYGAAGPCPRPGRSTPRRARPAGRPPSAAPG